MAIWDTGLVRPSGAFPPILAPTKLHTGSIASMHAALAGGTTQLLTASEKGHQVKLSQLDGRGGVNMLREWKALGFPRCVRWRSPHEAAVAGCSSFKR